VTANFEYMIVIYFEDHTGKNKFITCYKLSEKVKIIICCTDEVTIEPCHHHTARDSILGMMCWQTLRIVW